MRVAVLQVSLREGWEERLSELEGMLRGIHRLEPDILLLPEAWTSLDPLNNLDKALEESGEALERLGALAQDFGVAILGGGLYFNDEDDIFVACPLINPDGEVIGLQEKVHLYGREDDILRRGNSFKTFEIRGVRIGVLICHDIVYPEAARTLALHGAEILFNPARIVSKGVEAWRLYLQVRCLENRIPIYAANIWWPPKYMGGSCAIKPVAYGDEIYLPELVEARPGVSALLNEVDVKAVEDARRRRLSGRVPQAYFTSRGGVEVGDMS